ncbi:MAG: F0F1 ATP synthase subunit A [Armatimonadetes bacterium]|nr:F0F1 ATP synthase subunit A [Armatimonadota bacterium]
MEHHGSPWYPVAISGAIILFWTVLGAWGTRRLQLVPSGAQNILELIYTSLEGFVVGVMGPLGRNYAPFIATLFLYILTMNLAGLVPFLKSPTASPNTTIALALVAFCYVQFQGIRVLGLGGYLKHMAGEPIWLAWLMLPIHLIGELAKPLSLSLRLFGNIFGEDMVIVILAGLSPAVLSPFIRIVPTQFPMMLFGVFTSIVQALVFSMLTSIYIVQLVGEHMEHAAHREAEQAAH